MAPIKGTKKVILDRLGVDNESLRLRFGKERVSACTKEEDGDAKEGRGHKRERRSPLGTGGDGERWRQAEAALPGDEELQDRVVQPGRGEARQTQREEVAGEDGGRK
ncbi:hypothetical protein NDU88_002783 [Pleurodeles waltl]|uniref:Uncharacterized protein n=1 Tax=Pleurodeles waltl TaxID=8319 RepID=A0AAV7VFD8_PLEWA|nr:hypothetical protein NDU88_002783 [Pleurodeles waltl]